MKKNLPIIAYSVLMENTSDGPGFSAESQAYAFKMTRDNEWSLNFLMMGPPPYLSYMTGMPSFPEGNVAIGVSYAPGNRDYKKLKTDKASWVIVNRSDDINGILAAGLGVFLYVDLFFDTEEKLIPLLSNALITESNFMMAFQTNTAEKLDKKKEKITQVKTMLTKCDKPDVPVLISIGAEDECLVDAIKLPDVAGVLLFDMHYEQILELAPKILK